MIEIPSGAPMSNVQTAYDYFVSQGLSPAASAGIGIGKAIAMALVFG